MDLLAQLPRGNLRRKRSLFSYAGASVSSGLVAPGWDDGKEPAGTSSTAELPKLCAVPGRRQKSEFRGDTKPSSGTLTPEGFLPEVSKVGSHSSNDVLAACSIVETLLQQGVFRPKEKQQMRFVREVLRMKSLSCRGSLQESGRGLFRRVSCGPCREWNMLVGMSLRGLDPGCLADAASISRQLV